MQAAESTDPADVASQIDKARRIVDSRLLTQDEFKQIEARQLSKQLSVDKRVGRTAKRSRPDVDDALHQELVTYFILLFRLVFLGLPGFPFSVYSLSGTTLPVRPTSTSRSNGAQTASEVIEFASARHTTY